MIKDKKFNHLISAITAKTQGNFEEMNNFQIGHICENDVAMTHLVSENFK